MLNELFPRWSTRFLTLPLLGPVADDFDTWSSTRGIGEAHVGVDHPIEGSCPDVVCAHLVH